MTKLPPSFSDYFQQSPPNLKSHSNTRSPSSPPDTRSPATSITPVSDPAYSGHPTSSPRSRPKPSTTIITDLSRTPDLFSGHVQSHQPPSSPAVVYHHTEPRCTHNTSVRVFFHLSRKQSHPAFPVFFHPPNEPESKAIRLYRIHSARFSRVPVKLSIFR